jgi:hypothetical protein
MWDVFSMFWRQYETNSFHTDMGDHPRKLHGSTDIGAIIMQYPTYLPLSFYVLCTLATVA